MWDPKKQYFKYLFYMNKHHRVISGRSCDVFSDNTFFSIRLHCVFCEAKVTQSILLIDRVTLRVATVPWKSWKVLELAKEKFQAPESPWIWGCGHWKFQEWAKIFTFKCKKLKKISCFVILRRNTYYVKMYENKNGGSIFPQKQILLSPFLN